VLHTRDFDMTSSALLSDVDFPRGSASDPRRSPRGLFAGLAIGAGLWTVIIAAILSLR
jgi:hypothetical protein